MQKTRWRWLKTEIRSPRPERQRWCGQGFVCGFTFKVKIALSYVWKMKYDCEKHFCLIPQVGIIVDPSPAQTPSNHTSRAHSAQGASTWHKHTHTGTDTHIQIHTHMHAHTNKQTHIHTSTCTESITLPTHKTQVAQPLELGVWTWPGQVTFKQHFKLLWHLRPVHAKVLWNTNYLHLCITIEKVILPQCSWKTMNIYNILYLERYYGASSVCVS